MKKLSYKKIKKLQIKYSKKFKVPKATFQTFKTTSW